MTDWRGIPTEYRDAIVTGDARELARALPDASVDLVFTDPVYDRLEDYLWLAEEATRVLRPGGALLAFGSISDAEAICAALRAGGRPVRWICQIVYSAGNSHRFHPLGFNKWVPLYWAGGEPVRAFCDAQISTFEIRDNPHPWTKNVRPVRRFVDAFSRPGDVVYDPFTGGATVPVACKQLGRHFVAFEIDPETATLARERVRLTPEPLPGLEMPDPQLDLLEVP